MAETNSRVQKATSILKTQGLKPLLKTVGIFISQWFYLHLTYYLYEHTLKSREEKDFLPKISEYQSVTITNTDQIQELALKGFDFSPQSEVLKERIESGAVAFCFFVQLKIAHIGYVGFSQDAMGALEQPPYKVDFTKSEAFTGGAWTNPEFRSLGLAIYGYYRRLEYLKDQGRLKAFAAVRDDNVASHKMHAKFSPKIRADGHFYRILGLRFWKEKPHKDYQKN